MIRYFRAFVKAAAMMLKGQGPPTPYAELQVWMERSQQLVGRLRSAGAARQVRWSAVTIRIDGRRSSAETVLAAIEHHMTQEYPYLLRHETHNHVAAIYASNLNDQYRAACLQAAPELQDPAVQQALAALKNHLEAIPPQKQASSQ